MKIRYSCEFTIDGEDFVKRMNEVGFDAALQEKIAAFHFSFADNGSDQMGAKFEVECPTCPVCGGSQTYLEQNDEEGTEFNNVCSCHNISFMTKAEVEEFLKN